MKYSRQGEKHTGYEQHDHQRAGIGVKKDRGGSICGPVDYIPHTHKKESLPRCQHGIEQGNYDEEFPKSLGIKKNETVQK